MRKPFFLSLRKNTEVFDNLVKNSDNFPIRDNQSFVNHSIYIFNWIDYNDDCGYDCNYLKLDEKQK